MRALVVDDNRPLGEDLAEILRDEGYEVALFDDPRLAMERAAALRFELALLDVRMPGLDGVALYHQLAAAHPEARFVLMTAYAEDQRISEALAAGVRRVITKPVSVRELLLLLRELASEVEG